MAYYANIKQSIGIIGVGILIVLFLRLASLILSELVGNGLSFLVWDVRALGVLLIFTHW